jgi:anti-sigma B factor antagonist
VDTIVGIFASRESAEEALAHLLGQHIPEDRIVYLTRSEHEARLVSHAISAPGPQAASSAGLSIETGSLTPGARPVFALGFGGTASYKLAGPNLSPAVVASTGESGLFASFLTAGSSDAEFFQRILDEGNSVVIVRTNSSLVAATACKVFDQLALHMKRTGQARGSSVTFRRIPGGAVAEFTGRIALGDGTKLLRESVQNFLNLGYQHILLDLERVDYVDSAGIGELVRSHAAVKACGGNLKLVSPSIGVLRLLQLTKLDKVFDIASDQATALRAERHST